MRFRRGESLAAAIDRVTAEQFDIALDLATADPGDQAAAVHSTRKAIKRLRSMLRLVRGAIARECYEPDNQMMKLIAAELSSARDAWVMAQTLDGLITTSPEAARSLAPIADRVQARFHAESRAVLGNEAQMASIIEQLENVRKRSPRWTRKPAGEEPLPHTFDTIAPGLERVYRRGKRGMENAIDSPTDTLLHNWRKRAKYLRHQVEALNILDPGEMGHCEANLETLTDLLGDDHDLAVLAHRLGDDRFLSVGMDMTLVAHIISDRRHDLQKRSIAVGALIYVATPREFVAQLAAKWPEGPSF